VCLLCQSPHFELRDGAHYNRAGAYAGACTQVRRTAARSSTAKQGGCGEIVLMRAGKTFHGRWTVCDNEISVALFGAKRVACFVNVESRHLEMAQILLSELVNEYLAAMTPPTRESAQRGG
jgi:hypothetical protein